MYEHLLQRWTLLSNLTGLHDAQPLGLDLLARYGQPHRRYHGLAHLAEVLARLEIEAGDPRLQLAAWFHDAIYRPLRSDNEARSAALARDELRAHGMAPADAEFVAEAVLATADHLAADARFAPLIDADLDVLGAPPAEYDRYAAALRAEYRAVPDALFRMGRARFLRRLLDSPSIFQTGAGRQRGETQARLNLQREWSSLEPAA